MSFKVSLEDFKSEYVYIAKVTSDYVYIVSNRNGTTYKNPLAKKFVWLDKEVKRLKVDRSVSLAFKRNNRLHQFSRSRLASLNYFKDHIISIDLMRYNQEATVAESKPEEWKSGFECAIEMLKNDLDFKTKQVYLTDKEIFVRTKNLADDFSFLSLDMEGHFFLESVKYVSLSKISYSTMSLKEKRKEKETKENARILEGKVFVYYPNSVKDESLFVTSPVLRGDNDKSFSFGSKDNDKEGQEDTKRIFSITSKSNPCYANLEFIVNAGSTISKLYGYESLEFLDMMRILDATKVVNLTQISQTSRMQNPSHILAVDGIAWIFGYIHKETEYHKIKQLFSMTRTVLRNGLTYINDTKGLIDLLGKQVPLKTVKI